MAREIEVDRDLCMGSGQCCVHAPLTFDLDDLGVAVVLDPGGDPAPDVDSAVQLCPARALSFTGPSSTGPGGAGER